MEDMEVVASGNVDSLHVKNLTKSSAEMGEPGDLICVTFLALVTFIRHVKCIQYLAHMLGCRKNVSYRLKKYY